MPTLHHMPKEDRRIVEGLQGSGVDRLEGVLSQLEADAKPEPFPEQAPEKRGEPERGGDSKAVGREEKQKAFARQRVEFLVRQHARAAARRTARA